MSSGSNCLVAMNCQLIGPSRSPSLPRPWPTKRATASVAVANCLRLVQKRDALIEKTKPSGVSSRHLVQLSGLKVE